jgi:hypothetical protein
MSDTTIYTPLSRYLSAEHWPTGVLGPMDPDFLEGIAYHGGAIRFEGDGVTADVALGIVDELEFTLPLDAAFLVGNGPVTASLDATSERWSAEVSGNVFRLRLPRTVFVPVVEEDGEYVADPDPEHFVEVRLPFGIVADSEGGVDPVWPGEEAGTLSLPPAMLGDTGVVVSIEDLFLHLAGGPPPPELAAFELPNDWRGIAVRRARLHLPKRLQGKLEVAEMSLDLVVTFGEGGSVTVGLGAGVRVRVAQPLSLGDTGFVLEAGEAELSLRSGSDVLGDWRSLLENLTFALTGFRLTGPGIPGGALSGELRVVLRDGALVPDESWVKRYEPDDAHLAQLGIRHLHLDRQCLAVTWDEPRINHWLRQLAPDLFDASQPASHEVSLRVVFGGEVRLDWHITKGARTLVLPGVSVTTPHDVRVSLLLGPGGAPLSSAALALTFQSGGTPLIAASNFAWGRGEDRELQNDAERPPEEDPLFQLSVGVNPQHDGAATLVLLAMDLGEGTLPRFLRQLQSPIEPLDYTSSATLCVPTPWTEQPLAATAWTAKFRLNAQRAFDLPILRQEEEKPEEGRFPQVLRIEAPDLSEIDVDLTRGAVTIPVGVALVLGTMELRTEVDIGFRWENFALVVDHDNGLELLSAEPELPSGEFLGLRWTLKGTPTAPTPQGEPRFHYFTLLTKNHDYQVVQAPKAAFQIAYTAISDEPITFTVTNFAVSARGVSLNAAVTDQPAKLNGIDTRFRFHDTRIEVRDNRIGDFTLSGSGPLPPALVGEATADVSLQFAQRAGGLTLVAGSARLKGNKMLDCRGTRFRFSVDALGLRFVYDGRFHLYFTITGAAEFVPAGGDDPNGPLALLGTLRIDLVECPLTGDARVLARHVRFLIELPKPKSFGFLGAFEMELRAIGFIPSADAFGGDPAMLLTGQLKFAQGAGDTPDSRVDVHSLYIGLPRPGTFLPRIHFKELPVNLNFGAAFRLNGTVEFLDTPQEKGFTGEGVLQIQGLPTIAASFAFLRVRRNEESEWVRAWFIYLEVRQVSFPIPVVQFFLREVGLGFGYRYTLAGIKAADQKNDVRALLKELKALSRTQGDLSRRDRWMVDLEDEGQDPRWTIVLRALISQTSASPSPLKWEEAAEKTLPSVFLLDAVIAFRSDLTFLMSVRAWLNANYYDYVTDYKGLRGKPLFNGFVLLSPRQKRLLANLSSNPDGQLGPHPPLPDFVQKAIAGAQFTATLLIEPGLLHYELGWPNMLRWSTKVGPLNAEFRGGFLFRVSRRELVTGVSFLARASLKFEAGLDLKFVGARVSAEASLAYGARFIGVLSFDDPAGSSALYGGVGIEVRIRVSLEFWIRLKLGFVKIQKTFRFSLSIDFTAGLEVGFVGLSPSGVGLRGHGTLSVAVMGHRLHLSVKVGLNEGAVAIARARTEKYLHVGLEATEVEAIPGVDGAAALAPGASLAVAPPLAPAVPATAAMTSPTAGTLAEFSAEVLDLPSFAEAFAAESGRALGFASPDYSVFVLRRPPEEWTHFVLLPQGERPGEVGEPEPGFLPAPPRQAGAVEADFELRVPSGAFTLERFDPASGTWVPCGMGDDPQTLVARWKARWDAEVVEMEKVERHHVDGDVVTPDETPRPLTVAEYLRQTFVADPDTEEMLGDPEPLAAAERLADERVHTPSDDAFESAVRGAVEQFGGAPFFRRGFVREGEHTVPASAYERALEGAFRDDTTIYHGSGRLAAATERLVQAQQQATQLRGMVVQDLVADLKDYAGTGAVPKHSVAFSLGLVFRLRGTAPVWLSGAAVDGAPTLAQRVGPDAIEPGDPRPVRTFNVADTDFRLHPPQFQRVQQLTDATTIALSWDLAWERTPSGLHSAAQADPEHHLMQYEVRRRPLDSAEPEALFTVKPADALHRPAESGGVLQAIRPRFQVVDHFTGETAEDLAALPASGRSYLYTVTPVDFAGSRGRPLTLVATRFPNEPPLVPTDAELVVRYRLDPSHLRPENATSPGDPRTLAPDDLTLEWTEPVPPRGAHAVPVDKHVLVFRRAGTLPIGSYGLDAATQGPRSRQLPTTNARPLPTDVRVEVDARGPRHARTARVNLDVLRDRGVLPDQDGPWRPESWQVFVQTVSQRRVPSALAPVQLLLRVESKEVDPAKGSEERRPAELEWLPRPVAFRILPPEDGRAIPGTAHVPMPDPATPMRFPTAGGLGQALRFRAHPSGQRCIRFRWNQGPSGPATYPLDLNAGYHLLELDTDAHTTEVFHDPTRLGAALRRIQEIQMVPAADLLVTPGDTLATHQWEAWYPSAVRRHKKPEERAAGSEIAYGPWHTWRESLLEWPTWPGLTDAPDEAVGVRDGAVHPLLRRMVAALEDNPEGLPLGRTFNVDIQVTPPAQPGSLADLFRVTASAADPYGWSVLQRFGLSVAFTLRDERTNDVQDGPVVVEALQALFAALESDSEFARLRRHLHVELLFQAGRAVSLDPTTAGAEGLLALVQLSLRPAARQHLGYWELPLSGRAGMELDLVFTPAAGATLVLVDPADPASGEVELPADPDRPVVGRMVRLPLTGATTLLLRGRTAPGIGVRLARAPSDLPGLVEFGAVLVYEEADGRRQLRLLASATGLDAAARGRLRAAVGDDAAVDALLAVGTLKPFPLRDELVQYFTAPAALPATFAAAGGPGEPGGEWRTFRRYAESLNATDPTLPPELRVAVPLDATGVEAVLPDFLAWSQRFFDAGGDQAAPDGTERARTGEGPWLAAGYPRTGAPAHATPDAAGRLTYDYLLEDRWAHAFRYHVRPFGRYDLLWQSLRESRLFPGTPPLPAPLPEVDAGGVDVVLARTQRVARPLVLRSGRLDPPAVPPRPAAPGATWEVVVAQHPEQALAERNATLARQLGFQQVAFTLMRRFAYPEWPKQLADAVSGRKEIAVRVVEDVFPGIPDAYPAEPESWELDRLDEDAARELDLPLRLGTFAPGAMAIRWRSLPFFYLHRLLLVAQTTDTVSDANEVEQRDFQYRTPTPEGRMSGAVLDRGVVPMRARRLAIPLRRLWDSLPFQAQAEWSAEEPDGPDSIRPGRVPSSLPDPEVVYQVVETFSGNVEVQAEIFFDATAGAFARWQLGQRFLVEVHEVLPPQQERPHTDFVLHAVLQPAVEEQMTQEYDGTGLPAPTLEKVVFRGRTLVVVGVLTAEDVTNLRTVVTADPDRAAVERLHAEAWSAEPVSGIVALPAGTDEWVKLEESAGVSLVWAGPITGDQQAQLRALPGDDDFRAALDRLASAAVPGLSARVEVGAGLDQVPDSLSERISLSTAEGGGFYTGLTWQGPLFDDDLAALDAWTTIAPFRTAVAELAAQLDAAEMDVPLAPEAVRPTPDEIPELLLTQLVVGVDALAWRGRLRSAAQRDALLALPGDDAVRAAAAALVLALTGGTARASFSVPVRPTASDLPDGLRARLVVGRAVLRVHGVLPAGEARALRDAFVEAADRAAVERLYTATLDAGMRGRELRIRARRGSAAPSALFPIPTETL